MSHFRKATRGLKTYPGLRIFVFSAAKILFFSLLAANAIAARSSKTTATVGVRVLLESSIARVPPGATAAAAPAAPPLAAAAAATRGPVTPWPRRARVSLVFVALVQSSDRGPVLFFCGTIGHAWNPDLLMLMHSIAARAVRRSTRTAATGV